MSRIISNDQRPLLPAILSRVRLAELAWHIAVLTSTRISLQRPLMRPKAMLNQD